jgi:uncharacterized protein YeaO (DUF488 family)
MTVLPTNALPFCYIDSMKIPEIKIKRIYENFDNTDGYRILVDRLWPRGVKKETAHIDEWPKDITPSPEIRTAYDHVPDRWATFRNRYTAELENNEKIPEYLDKWEDKDIITLLYASKDPKYTHALILQDYIQKQYKGRG